MKKNKKKPKSEINQNKKKSTHDPTVVFPTKAQNGGARPGAGRKLGAETIRTREIAKVIAKSGNSPLEIMYFAMTEHLNRAKKILDINVDELSKEDRETLERKYYRSIDSASDIARDAAPFVHPRLAAIAFQEENKAPQMTDTRKVADTLAKIILKAEERLRLGIIPKDDEDEPE